MSRQNLRVLLVGGTSDDRQFIEWLLRNTNHELVHESAGQAENRPSWQVDVDIGLFAFSGYHELRNHRHVVHRFRVIPVLVLTKEDDDDEIATFAVQLGAQDCLSMSSLSTLALRRSIRCAVARHLHRLPVTDSSPPVQTECPHWDPDLRELRLGDLIVKKFRQPSPNQELILATFEEEGWPLRIDDPLPVQEQYEPKSRLRATIKSLNRCQQNDLIRFRGDGTGEAILWSAAPSPVKRSSTRAIPERY